MPGRPSMIMWNSSCTRIPNPVLSTAVPAMRLEVMDGCADATISVSVEAAIGTVLELVPRSALSFRSLGDHVVGDAGRAVHDRRLPPRRPGSTAVFLDRVRADGRDCRRRLHGGTEEQLLGVPRQRPFGNVASAEAVSGDVHAVDRAADDVGVLASGRHGPEIVFEAASLLSVMITAAAAVPPRATNSATSETTLANVK